MNVRRFLSWAGKSLVLCSLAGCTTAVASPPFATASEGSSPAGKPIVDCSVKPRVLEDTTLYKKCSPYELRGGIDVLGNATLTIEAGVEVRFHDRDWLEISAANTWGGRLIARGTPREPIVLTSVHPETTAAGTWFGLWFNAGTRTSVLSNAIIRAAGGENQFLKPPLIHGCITATDVTDGQVTIENVVLENCVVAGMVLKHSQPQLAGVHINDTDIGLQLEGVARQAVGGGVTYRNVQRKIVQASANGFQPPK